MPPPTPVSNGEARSASVAATDGWVRGVAVTSLWSASSGSGVWIAIPGIGWKQLSAASESGHSHLVLLALLAKSYRLPVAYHEDSRGHVDQILI